MTKCEVLLSYAKLFVSFGQKHKENSSILIARKRWSYVRICPIIGLQNANIDKRLTGRVNFRECDWFSEWWNWCDALCVYYSWRQLRLSTVVFCYYGAIQVLRNADGGGGVSDFLEKSVTKV